VSASTIYFGRGDIATGEHYVDEAWLVSGAGEPHGSVRNLHAVLPAHIGKAFLSMSKGDYQEAIRYAEQAVALADSSGYIGWSIYRLLPIIAESYLWMRDPTSATPVIARLRTESERHGHRLGLAWAQAGEALIEYNVSNNLRGVDLMKKAADTFDAIPLLPDAARVRRQMAGVLVRTGAIEEAVRELKRVHEIFVRLRMEPELKKTRDELRELGVRLPARTPAPLTAR
jgi:tetratricopeptide (TPR) repeat protein